jgi:hypothetical protein
MEDLPERYMTSTKMADTLPAVRYIKSQISLYIFLAVSHFQNPSLQVTRLMTNMMAMIAPHPRLEKEIGETAKTLTTRLRAVVPTPLIASSIPRHWLREKAS